MGKLPGNESHGAAIEYKQLAADEFPRLDTNHSHGLATSLCSMGFQRNLRLTVADLIQRLKSKLSSLCGFLGPSFLDNKQILSRQVERRLEIGQ